MSEEPSLSSATQSNSPSLDLPVEDLEIAVKFEENISPDPVFEIKPETTPKVEDAPAALPLPPKAKPGPQLIGHLPRAETEALKTFVEIEANHYQYGTLGRSREALKSMTCDCQFDDGQCLSLSYAIYRVSV